MPSLKDLGLQNSEIQDFIHDLRSCRLASRIEDIVNNFIDEHNLQDSGIKTEYMIATAENILEANRTSTTGHHTNNAHNPDQAQMNADNAMRYGSINSPQADYILMQDIEKILQSGNIDTQGISLDQLISPQDALDNFERRLSSMLTIVRDVAHGENPDYSKERANQHAEEFSAYCQQFEQAYGINTSEIGANIEKMIKEGLDESNPASNFERAIIMAMSDTYMEPQGHGNIGYFDPEEVKTFVEIIAGDPENSGHIAQHIQDYQNNVSTDNSAKTPDQGDDHKITETAISPPTSSFSR